MPRVVFRSRVDARPEELFRWHTSAGAFSRLAPPFDPIELVEREQTLHAGDIRHLRVGPRPVHLNWTALHDNWVEGEQFRDVQVRGPFAKWEHTHCCLPAPEGRAWLQDELEYALPLPLLSEPFARPAMASRLLRTFLYRHWRTRFDLLRRPAEIGGKIVVSGASGLVGQQLCNFLKVMGFQVIELVRRKTEISGQAEWEPYGNRCPAEVLEGSRAVINLSGKGVMDGNWGEGHRRQMWDSRVQTTACLAQAIAKLKNPPEAFITASGVGFYGDSRHPLDETGEQGKGFLADLCQAWESEARKASVRSAQLRIGAVLNLRGGALKEMLLPFWLGLGATIGGGRVPFSWISMEDLLGVVLHAILTPELSGPVNVVAPQPLDFRGFADTLASVLGRPCGFCPV